MKTTLALLLTVVFLTLGHTYAQELAPHFTGDKFKYIGEYFQNYTYLMASEDGDFCGKLAEGRYVTDVWSVREEILMLNYQPASGKYAVLDPSDPASWSKKPGDLKWESFPEDSIVVKAWKKATNPQKHKKDTIKGKNQSWIYVDVLSEAKAMLKFYVGPEIYKEPEFMFTPLLELNQERMLLYLDPANNKCSYYAIDLLGVPLEEKKYRDMKEGDFCYGVLNAIKSMGCE